MTDNKKNILFGGLVYSFLTTLLLAIIFFSYVVGSNNDFMDAIGWAYLSVSSLFHAGLFTLLPYLILFIPLALTGSKKAPFTVLGIIYALTTLLFVVNRFVFKLYHFHINGFVLDMLFSEGADEIFVFSFWLYMKALLIVIAVALVVFALQRLSLKVAARVTRRKRFRLCSFSTYLAAALLSQGIHVYGAASLHSSILEGDAFLPYYFPLSMNSALDRMGIIDKEELSTITIQDNTSKLNYPISALESDPNAKRLNIILIVIDSWNFRTLTEECMPNLWAFKERSEYFSNHLSSSNGTRGGIFGLFTGLSSYSWKSFEYSSLNPVLVEQLVGNGYDINIYPSSSFKTPPFDRIFFKGMDIRTSTEGGNPFERDCQLTADFVGDLPLLANSTTPSCSFLFYDLAHAISLPKDKNTHFQPAWTYADYTRLSNNTDPTAYYNLYRNCVFVIDSLLGIVFGQLEANGMLDNSIVLVTGDHGQEFNENHKNYWGHAGNYSRYQVQVPLVLHYPGVTAAVHGHRTTHYDVVPTLLGMAMGVTNEPSDYSMGMSLLDSASRGWHVVGNDLNYAFITEDGYIIEKKGNGNVSVYDKDLNLQKGYKASPKQLNDNLQKLNRFF